MPGLKLSTTLPPEEFKPAPADIHLGICVQVIDLGTHVTAFRNLKTGAIKSKHEMRLAFELPFAKMEDGRPFLVAQKYNNVSLYPTSSFRKVLETWRGKAFSLKEVETFDMKTVLGAPAMVSVVHNAKDNGTGIWVNINGLTRVGRNPETGAPITPPTPINPLVFFELTKERFSRAIFDGLSPKTQDYIMTASEWSQFEASAPQPSSAPSAQGPSPSETPWPTDDDIPF